MDPISLTASIIAAIELAASVLSYLNSIRTYQKDCARCMQETSNACNLLVQLRSQLEESNGEEPWNRAVHALAVENGPLEQFGDALKQLDSKIAPKPGFRKVQHVLVWKFTKTEIENIISRIIRLNQLVQIALEMDHIKLSRAIKDDTTEMKQTLARVENDFKDITLNQKTKELCDWLSLEDFGSVQSNLRSRRKANSAAWFLNSSQFVNWLRTPRNTLFCPGIPGAGKTVIVSIVIDKLLQERESGDFGLAFLYCNYKRKEEQTLNNLLRVVLKQLVQPHRTFPSSLRRIYEDHKVRNTNPSFDELSACAKEILESIDCTYIVVDALDECRNDDGTRSKLMNLLRQWNAVSDVRILMTSRSIPEVVGMLGDHTALEITASEIDILNYLDDHLHLLPNFVSRDTELQNDVKTEIIKAADGMFLLALLHFDTLKDKLTRKSLKATLKTLPKGQDALTKAYKSCQERIDGQMEGHQLLAKKTLAWMACANRRLRPNEILHALAVEQGDTEFDETNIPELDDVINVCAGLVRVDWHSEAFEFAHYTVQEYLEQVLPTWIPNAQEIVGRTCITYLSFDDFLQGAQKDYRREWFFEYPLLNYAAFSWHLHYREASEALNQAALDFVQQQQLALNAAVIAGLVRSTRFIMHYGRQKLTGVTGLHLAAAYDIPELLHVLFAKGLAADLKDSFGRTPLHWAVMNGQKNTIKILIERTDVDVNSLESENGLTPFLMAAQYGCAEVIQLLADCPSVNIHATTGEFQQTALHLAIEGCNQRVGDPVATVQVLLDLDVKLATKVDRDGVSPLFVAVSQCHENILRLILQYDATNLNDRDCRGDTALHRAVRGFRIGVFQVLIARDDICVNSRDGLGRTPLDIVEYIYNSPGSDREKLTKLLRSKGGISSSFG